MPTDALLFIDANRHLDLYRTVKGKKLLAPLAEQADEYLRDETASGRSRAEQDRGRYMLLAEQLKEIKVYTYQMPDHLFGSDEGKNTSTQRAMGKLSTDAKAINADIEDLITDIINQIVHGEDQVSKALAPIFAKAVPHT